jgi:hypothetical protein
MMSGDKSVTKFTVEDLANLEQQVEQNE